MHRLRLQTSMDKPRAAAHVPATPTGPPSRPVPGTGEPEQRAVFGGWQTYLRFSVSSVAGGLFRAAMACDDASHKARCPFQARWADLAW